MNASTKKFLKKVLLALIAIIPGILGLFIGYNRGEVNTQIETINTLNGMQNIEADNVTINYYSGADNYEETLNKIVSEVNALDKENETLAAENSKAEETSGELLLHNSQLVQENEELSLRNSELTQDNTELQHQIAILQEMLEKLNMTSNLHGMSVDFTPVLNAHEWKDSNTYTSFAGDGNNGFTMYGKTYTNGFTMSMGASYNIWGNGEQYAIYNIESISDKYSTIKFLIGHVDGYETANVTVNIYLDKAVGDSPDYIFDISPDISPQEYPVNIVGKRGMIIQVCNTGGGTNKVGFANPTFE